MQAAAAMIAKYTKARERVLVYGPAGRVLYEAKRKPLVPPFNNFFLNVRKAVVIPLTPDQEANLDEIQRRIAELSCPRLERHPIAIAMCDWAAWSGGVAEHDVHQVCPRFEYLRYPEYSEVGKWGCWRVWIRSDRYLTQQR
jgi:hypothetical protein